MPYFPQDAGGDALVANPLSQFAATTSAQLAGVLSDEVGTGKFLLDGGPVFAAGSASASSWPKLTAGTVLTTPETGALEKDADVLYGSPSAGNRGVWRTEYIGILNAAYTLTSQNTIQKLFNWSANGALTLPTGTYMFQCLFSLSAMDTGGNSNAKFDFKGGGTATIGDNLFQDLGLDNAVATNGAWTGQMSTATATLASLCTTTTNGALQAFAHGAFRVTGAGTIIPSITLVVAAAAVVAKDSYFICWPIGSATVATVGPWS